jgi:NAD(P)-dependent dehydrogenase (short-subunit alcohol dehydrogenase family)
MMAQTDARVVLLTGAAGGIGTVMTKALLEAGHFVAAVDRDASALDRLAAALGAGRERLHAIIAELTVEADCRAAVEKTVGHFGRIEGLINNAGIGPSAVSPDAETRPPQIEEIPTEIWDRFFAINVRAPMLLAAAALPHMRPRKWGRIVNNTTSYRTMLRVVPYGASKSALESMSAVWAAQLEGSGISVNVLVPGGPTDTAFISAASGWPRDKMLRPQIMGAPAAWLMSNASDGVNGRRFTAAEWDASLPADQAARAASREIGWPELADKTAWW